MRLTVLLRPPKRGKVCIPPPLSVLTPIQHLVKPPPLTDIPASIGRVWWVENTPGKYHTGTEESLPRPYALGWRSPPPQAPGLWGPWLVPALSLGGRGSTYHTRVSPLSFHLGLQGLFLSGPQVLLDQEPWTVHHPLGSKSYLFIRLFNYSISWQVFLEHQALFGARGTPWRTSSRGPCPHGAHRQTATTTSATNGRNTAPVECSQRGNRVGDTRATGRMYLGRLWGWAGFGGQWAGGCQGTLPGLAWVTRWVVALTGRPGEASVGGGARQARGGEARAVGLWRVKAAMCGQSLPCSSGNLGHAQKNTRGQVFRPGQAPLILLSFVLRSRFWAAPHIPGDKLLWLAGWLAGRVPFLSPLEARMGTGEQLRDTHANTNSLSLFPSLSLSHTHTHTHTHTHISIFLPTYQLSHCLSSMQILVCHLHESISFMGRVNLMVLITAALQLC